MAKTLACRAVSSTRDLDGRRGRNRLPRIAATAIVALAIASLVSRPAFALIQGGTGNQPITDPGWPRGAAPIFNDPARVAWWEGPPFGGGQWHAECRGDARALNAALARFAGLDVKTRRVIVNDGVGKSFWLNPNNEPTKEAAARIDWSFTVWQPDRWQMLRRLPADLNPIPKGDMDKGPPAEIEVFTGGGVRWSDVKVPTGLEVVDRRLEAHGFRAADGLVLEGKVDDLATGKPLAARVRLERIERPPSGGYRYVPSAQAEADAEGHWVLKHAPAGWHRVVVEAHGFVPRIAGFLQSDGQPRWTSYDCGLARPGPISGRVVDVEGHPLGDVEVKLLHVEAANAGRYQSPDESPCRTGPDGRFHSDRIPIGRATIFVHKRGYCGPGLGQAVATPTKDVELRMIQAAGVRIVVEFPGPRPPGGYIVEMEPEGGAKVGTWGGSAEIDPANRVAFREIPPGRYVLRGRPNPSHGDDHSAGPVTLELKGGETLPITLHAR